LITNVTKVITEEQPGKAYEAGKRGVYSSHVIGGHGMSME
jgi:hypothetical protein